jgi:1,4-dihydroxy-6-naphthoate synthase
MNTPALNPQSEIRNPKSFLTFAHSPDPDDAYMFYGFETGAVRVPGYEIRHHLEDIQTLNERAFRSEFEITAVSAHAYAHLMDKYWVMTCGMSVGRGYGPILITKKGSAFRPNARIAVPGKWTTAALVLDLWLAEQKATPEKVLMPFDQILPAVARGDIDAGVIIHEGQLTYQNEGAEKVWDAGEWWLKKTGLPLPLGLDVVRRDLGLPLAKQLSQALRDSILYANANREKAIEYALQYGRGLNRDLGMRFVGMYVNDDTLQQGEEVQAGLKRLYEEAYAAGLIPQKPTLTFV